MTFPIEFTVRVRKGGYGWTAVIPDLPEIHNVEIIGVGQTPSAALAMLAKEIEAKSGERGAGPQPPETT